MTATDLDAAMSVLAAAPSIIIASDFDGTLSALAPQPEAARPLPGAIDALMTLTRLPGTKVAVVSGRSLADLALIADIPAPIERVGSHGAEYALGAEDPSATSAVLDVRAELRLQRLVSELTALAEATPGSRVELKPFSVAFHYRNAEPERAQRALTWIDDTLRRREGLWNKPGHRVIELMVLRASKAHAIDVLRQRSPGAVVFYVGDDVTDEDVFVSLRGGDIGCKVGSGETAASCRVPDPDSVVTLLREIAARRANAAGSPAVLDGTSAV